MRAGLTQVSPDGTVRHLRQYCCHLSHHGLQLRGGWGLAQCRGVELLGRNDWPIGDDIGAGRTWVPVQWQVREATLPRASGHLGAI